MAHSERSLDAVVVGAGPNGLSAAIRLAIEGLSVIVLEGNAEPGGGARTGELMEPGFLHDLGSAVHPLGIGSPFFEALQLERFGLSWIEPEIQVAHPFDNGQSVVMFSNLEETAMRLPHGGRDYREWMEPLIEAWPILRSSLLGPVFPIPKHPVGIAKFGLQAALPARVLSHLQLRSAESRALFAGVTAHSGLPFHAPLSSAVGLVLGILGHVVGWPVPEGGARSITSALVRQLEALGGVLQTDTLVETLDDLPQSRVVLFDVTPRQFLNISGSRVSGRYRRTLESYRYGPASFKVDYALDGPIPWASPDVSRAATVHLGGTIAEIAHSEAEVAAGRIPERPYVLLTQPSICDSTRAPRGKHVVWAYCHVPAGSDTDMSQRISSQIERFAPGFRDLIISEQSTFPSGLEAQNPNLVDGDIMGGSGDIRQMIARPLFSSAPYRTPLRGVYLCSASTPPGPGVHGMCGYHAAELAIRDHFS